MLKTLKHKYDAVVDHQTKVRLKFKLYFIMCELEQSYYRKTLYVYANKDLYKFLKTICTLNTECQNAKYYSYRIVLIKF